MAINKFYNSFLEYLIQNGIKVGEQNSQINYKNVTEKQVEDQLLIISEFHKKVMGYNGYMNMRLDNKTGKLIEQYKVYNKKLKRDIKKIQTNLPKNEFEELLLEKGDKYLGRAEECIEQLYKWDYIEMISRSMQRIEICLGCTDFNNLSKNEYLLISDLQHCCYNMVEFDGVYLINKLKNKSLPIDWDKMIVKYCNFEGLEFRSVKFMSAIISYPYEFMKCCNRYRESKKDWDELKYKEKLQKIVNKDSFNLIS